ncbi:MAG: iron-containing alcohol dehydrogenase [Marinicaulis sp.]|nr:iron-containing alcohol dehydrogenase [Marinicaulis sp.]NNE40354.1 iron-containing alcohol dehydrogenase [Marinicaulis sp.]NNL89153.1 iron-containing alcohol dehydrogenase [Marinicaulis sp.]
MNFTFNTPPEIVFKSGATRALGEVVKRRFQRPILLTDKGLVDAGLVAPALTSLKSAGHDVLLFDDVAADPPAAKVKQAVAAAREHNADGVIGLGGGSSMDTAKVVAVLLNSNQTLEEIYGVDQVKAARLPLVLCPSTSGTGSEVTSISVITTEEDTKVAVVDNALYPDLAVLDPELTFGLPRHVTAATGIDAMVHAIEAYTNIHRKNPVSDALAREALRLLSANIVTACEHPGDRPAREAMLLGAMLAGQAFANSPVGAVHGMAYPLGGIFHVPHGLSNSLMLEPVLKFNAPNADHQYAELCDCIGAAAVGSNAEKCDAFIKRIVDIVEATGVERRLAQLGISHNDLPRMAEDAMKGQRVLQNNPRTVTYEDALQMYTDVL